MTTKLPSETLQRLRELPSRSCAVYQALHHADQRLSSREIEDATGLRQRTVQRALDELEEAGLAVRKEDVDTPGQPLYWDDRIVAGAN